MSHESFPNIDIDNLLTPVYSRVLLQARHSQKKTAGGILLSDVTQDERKRITSVFKVVAVGPLAFKDSEGSVIAEVSVGDYVVAGKNIGVKLTVPNLDDASDPCVIHVCDDLDVLVKVADPLKLNNL